MPITYIKQMNTTPNQEQTKELNYLYSEGRLPEAEAKARELTKKYPHNLFCWNVLGAALSGQKKLNSAIATFRQILKLKPDHADAYYNLGIVLQESGTLDEAIACYRQSLKLRPDFAEAHNNFGNALKDMDKSDEALNNYYLALKLKPDFVEAYNSLGNLLEEMDKLDDAVNSYNLALKLKPDFAEAHNNLGNALKGMGKTTEALNHYKNAVKLKPDYNDALNNILSILSEPSSPEVLSTHFDQLVKKVPESEKPAIENSEIVSELQDLENVVALVGTGRSGSLFFHSLFDGHPDITTIPGPFFKGFFHPDTWNKLHQSFKAHDWRKLLIERFSHIYEILFDARSEKPVPGNPMGGILGLNAGLTTLGADRDRFLQLDRQAFSQNLLSLLNNFKMMDRVTFFKLIHIAYERTLGHTDNKKVLLYHIHNPDFIEAAHFIKSFQKSRFIQIVREPVQSLESWCISRLPANFRKDEYKTWDSAYQKVLEKRLHKLVSTFVTKFLSTRHPAFSYLPLKTVRLEDVKKNNRDTMLDVARWMGIEEHESLYRPSFQGHDYWGPTSNLSPQIIGLDQASIKRRVGVLFSDKDVLIMNTLFYHERVFSGYEVEDETSFRGDLARIEPLLDEPFDFERLLCGNSPDDQLEQRTKGALINMRHFIKTKWLYLKNHSP